MRNLSSLAVLVVACALLVTTSASAQSICGEWLPGGGGGPDAALNGTVFALCEWDHDNDGLDPVLVAGGDFTATQSGTPLNRIAYWDGSQWNAIGGGFPVGWVSALTVYDDDGDGPNLPQLIAGGAFPLTAGNIYKWDGINWVAFGTMDNAPVRALAVHDEDGDGPNLPALFAGGDFFDSVQFNYIARWDGTTWSPLLTGLNNRVRTIESFDADADGPNPPLLIIGGDFTSTFSRIQAPRIIVWYGTGWSLLGSGLGTIVGDTCSFDADGDGPALPSLIACAGSGVFRWSGQSWVTMGSFGGSVVGLSSFDRDGAGPLLPNLVAVGTISSAGGFSVDGSVLWSGSNWMIMGLGLQRNASVVLARENGELVAGGGFTGRWAVWHEPYAITQTLPQKVYAPGTIEVEVAGKGPFTYEWRLGGEVISTQNPITISKSGGGPPCSGGLFEVNGGESFIHMSIGATMPIQCTITGPAGECTLYSYLALASLYLGTPFDLNYLQPGQSDYFFSFLQFEGGDVPTVVWSRNGMPLSDGPTGTGSTITTFLEEPFFEPALFISNVGVHDTGLYTCTATNDTCGTVTSGAGRLSLQIPPAGPYLSLADSPFDPNDPSFAYFHLEDFEDGLLNTPGVTADFGVVQAPTANTDSVDADDGVVDGLGQNGYSYYRAGNTLTFTFDLCTLGGLPTHVGIAVTDIDAPGIDQARILVFDRYVGEDFSIYQLSNFGDGVTTGGTAEDRFVGFEYLPGIARLEIRTDGPFEVDHLQYGSIVPLVCCGDTVTNATLQPPPDGIVDGADLAFLIGAWGANPGSPADIVTNATLLPPPDGIVDGADLAVLLGAWGPCE